MKALLKKSLPLIALLCLSPIAALATTAVVDSLPPTCSANTEVYLPASSLGQIAGLYRCNNSGVWIFTPPISAADVVTMGAVSLTPLTDQNIAGPHALNLDGGNFSVIDDALVPVSGLNYSIYNEIIPPVNSGMPSGIRLAPFSGSFGWSGTGTTPVGIQGNGIFLQPFVGGGITGGEMKTFISWNPDFEDGSTLSGLVGFECDHGAIGSAQITGFNTCFSGAIGTGGWTIDVTGVGGSAAFSIHRVCHSTDMIQNGGVPTDCWWSGNGSPNGAVTAAVGSFYAQLDGGAGTSWWFKESGSGNSGWRARSDFTGSTVTVGLLQEPLSTPANSSAACAAGQLWADTGFMYVCTASNTIKRSALSTF